MFKRKRMRTGSALCLQNPVDGPVTTAGVDGSMSKAKDKRTCSFEFGTPIQKLVHQFDCRVCHRETRRIRR